MALSRDWLEKLTEYVIAEQEPAVSLNGAENLTPSGQGWDEIVERGRRNLWKRTFDRIDSPDILLLEFGVWKGDCANSLGSTPRTDPNFTVSIPSKAFRRHSGGHPLPGSTSRAAFPRSTIPA